MFFLEKVTPYSYGFKLKILSLSTGNTVFPVFTFRSTLNNFVLIECCSQESMILRLLPGRRSKLRKEKGYETEGIILNSSIGISVH